MRLVGKAFLAFTLLNSPGFCREIFHLSTGFDISASAHTQTGDRIMLVTDAGTLEFPASEISGFEVLADEPRLVKQQAPVTRTPTPLEVLKEAAHHEGTAPEFARLVRSVAVVESGLRQDAVSPKGAIGLMQLMPGTARDLNVRPSDAGQNALGGAHYLAQLLERYKNDAVLALAAYNAGPGAVDKYHGLPPFRETQDYVRRVLHVYESLGEAELTSSFAHAQR
jgi:hypothetical protein